MLRTNPLDPLVCADFVRLDYWQDRVKSSLDSDCLLWIGSKTVGGYGMVWMNSVKYMAHRISWVAANGEDIPFGFDIDHLCRVRSCVRYSHLEPVERRVNLLRGETKPANQVARTHCPKGHLLEEGNLVASGLRNGKRQCHICAIEHSRQLTKLIGDAQRVVGMSRDEYRSKYGRSIAVAQRLLAEGHKEINDD